MHSQRAGHDVVTFEMLYECFRDQVRASTSAPVQIGGGGIGMVRCTRQVLMGVRLISSQLFRTDMHFRLSSNWGYLERL
jgi:origin recognition complex subunit 4